MNEHAGELSRIDEESPTAALSSVSGSANAGGHAAELPGRDGEVSGERIPDGAGVEVQPEFGVSVEEEVGHDSAVRCEDIGGCAGTGKTTLIKQRIEEDPTWGRLCSTTGISAINLDTTTINSLLGYFDTDSLRDSYLTGQLARRIHAIALDHRNLVVDEKSMLDAHQLDLIYRATEAVNDYADMKQPFGIVLCGDFAQLPVVKGAWCFEAECWEHFQRNSTLLTHIWRQEQRAFLDALNAARRGDGLTASSILSSVGVTWHTALDTDYDGTTLVPKNDQVDRYNQLKLDAHRGTKFTVSSRRWGQQRAEWKAIPYNMTLKEGCYVMLLSNARIEDGKFPWVNGDCGHIEAAGNGILDIKLVRTGQVVSVPKIVRSVAVKDKPDGYDSTVRQEGYHAGPHRDNKGKYVLGEVEYFPVRLAYASTIHKSQGLSLDRIQIDIRNSFFGMPSMAYVALSRCRTLEGLRIVGQRERFIMNCNADPRVQRWL